MVPHTNAGDIAQHFLRISSIWNRHVLYIYLLPHLKGIIGYWQLWHLWQLWKRNIVLIYRRRTYNMIMFWDYLIFYQIFLSLKVKRSVIISNKYGIYELPYELPNYLRLRVLGSYFKLFHYFTWKPEFASNILSIILGWPFYHV